MKEFETIATVYIASTLLKVLSRVTECLQSKMKDCGIIPKAVGETKETLQSLSDEECDKVAHGVS